MKIVLIGSSGFVGTRLISLLKEKSGLYDVKNIDLLPSPYHNEITEIGDVRRLECMEEKLQGADWVVLLAAQHRDDVSPSSLYYDTNVKGMENTLRAMEKNNSKRLIFFSSVAVYGLNKINPNETYPVDPFNHYGKSKWQAEQMLQKWYERHPDWCIQVVRPTVIFGERNRGNVYNLLRQISRGKFLMVGDGNNKKSMAYVGNVASFVEFLIRCGKEGYNVYNYIDKPDLTMNELVEQVSLVLGRYIPAIRFPYGLGMAAGYVFDMLAKVAGKKLIVSSVRIKKFCATTQFDSAKAMQTGFTPPYTLREGLARTLRFEFLEKKTSIDRVVFRSE